MSASWGGARQGAGRKKGSTGRTVPSDERKDRTVWARVTETEKAKIEQRAQAAGKSVSRYMVDCALGIE